MTILHDALVLAWYLVPGYLANMAPVFATRIFPRWTTPLDFGSRLGGKPLLGRNKTWRGLFAGVAIALAAAGLQSLVTPGYPSWLGWGLATGFGALAGDALKSFFKRRLAIAPGKPWIPFDQVDHVLGALALGALLYWPGWLPAALVVLGTFAGHILINRIGYALRLREEAW